MSMVQVHLNGLFPSDFTTEGRLHLNLGDPNLHAQFTASRPATIIQDARQLQAGITSEAAFFAEHGFVLLNHESAVTDWTPTAAPDNEVACLYLPEVEALIRNRLLPGERIAIEQSPFSLRQRGRGTANLRYGAGVHQDMGLTADDARQTVEAYTSPEIAAAWRGRYNREEVAGFMMINFWRTTNMTEPLRHMPLAVCDPRSVEPDDVIPTAMDSYSPSGKPNHQLSLRYNAAHRWYFYPAMTNTEVLAFKIFQRFKSDPLPGLQTCFHTAFADPDTPEDAEERQSCEHRVGVFILRD